MYQSFERPQYQFVIFYKRFFTETFISFNLAAWVKIALLPLTFETTFRNYSLEIEMYAIHLSELVLRMQLLITTIYSHVHLVLL